MKTAIYKVAYNLGGSTNYTYIEAPTDYKSAKKHIKNILHSVQGMNTREKSLITADEAIKIILERFAE